MLSFRTDRVYALVRWRLLAAVLSMMLIDTVIAPARADDVIYAQRLVTETLAQHPEIAHLVMHVTPPHRPDTENLIIASSVGRLGKLADEDDLRIMRTGSIETVVARSGDRFNVSLPMLDQLGNTIGVLAVGFPYQAGDDTAPLRLQAERLRDALRSRVPSVDKLFDSH